MPDSVYLVTLQLGLLQAHLQRLLAELAARGMIAAAEKAEVDPKDVGIVGREDEYEGGFVVVKVMHHDDVVRV